MAFNGDSSQRYVVKAINKKPKSYTCFVDVEDDYLPKVQPSHGMTFYAKKEIQNLSLAHNAGVRCPQPIYQRTNVIVLSYIGQSNEKSPKLKDAKLTFEEYILSYSKVTKIICK